MIFSKNKYDFLKKKKIFYVKILNQVIYVKYTRKLYF